MVDTPAPRIQFIIASGGDFQQQFTGLQFPNQMQVRVTEGSAGVANLPIVFRLPSGPGVPSAQFTTYGVGDPYTSEGVTGIDGYVLSPTFVANNYVGQFNPTCEIRDVPSTKCTYSQTNKARVADVATSLSPVSGGGQYAAYNAAFAQPLIVQVYNQYGDIYRGPAVSVTLTIQAGRGTFPGAASAATLTTDSNGVVTSPTLTAGSVAGSFSVTATATGASSTSFTETAVNPAIATSLKIYSGNAQKANPSSLFGAALRVQVQNGVGGPVAGVVVTFTAPGTGATCTFPGATINGTSDAGGIAASSIPTANATLGTYNVTASSSGLSNATFNLTNGLTFLAEVCTLYEATSCANTGAGGVGTSPPNWTNPQNTSAAATGGSYANVTVATPNSNRSNYMLEIQPASWAAIPDDAKITRAYIQFWHYGTGVVSNEESGFVFVGVSTSGTGGSYTFLPTLNTWVQSPLLVANFATGAGGYVTGAMLKNVNNGFRFRGGVSSSGNAGVRINGLQTRVCYQLVDKPVSGNVPLLFCEA